MSANQRDDAKPTDSANETRDGAERLRLSVKRIRKLRSRVVGGFENDDGGGGGQTVPGPRSWVLPASPGHLPGGPFVFAPPGPTRGAFLG